MPNNKNIHSNNDIPNNINKSDDNSINTNINHSHSHSHLHNHRHHDNVKDTGVHDTSVHDTRVHIHPIVKNLKLAFYLNLFFTIIEFIGGAMTNSVAIMSDAVHDLGDTFAIGASLYFENYSQKGRDNKYSYGYKRFSPLAALINSIILISGSAIIIFEAVPRLFNPSEVNSEGMFYLAIFGVLINSLAAFKLYKAGKESGENVNARAIMLHLVEDVLGWTAVLIGSVVIYYTQLYIIDPLLSLAIAVFILFNAGKNLKQIFNIFLQASPNNTNLDLAITELNQINGVVGIHDAHSWTLDGNYNVLTMHIEVSDKLSSEDLVDIKSQSFLILEKHNFQHYTIELEFEREDCSFGDC